MRTFIGILAVLLVLPLGSAQALPPASSQAPDVLGLDGRQYDPSIEKDTVSFLGTHEGYHGYQSHEFGFWTYLPFGSTGAKPYFLYGQIGVPTTSVVAYPGVASGGDGIFYMLAEDGPTGLVEYKAFPTAGSQLFSPMANWPYAPMPVWAPFATLFPRFEYEGWVDPASGDQVGVWTEHWSGGWMESPGVAERVMAYRTGSGFVAWFDNTRAKGLGASGPSIDADLVAYQVEVGPRDVAEIHVGILSTGSESYLADGVTPSLAMVDRNKVGYDAIVVFAQPDGSGHWTLVEATVDVSGGYPSLGGVRPVPLSGVDCLHVRDPKVGGVERRADGLVLARGEACGPNKDQNYLLLVDLGNAQVYLVDELPGSHHLDQRPQYDLATNGRIVYSKFVGPGTEDYDIFAVEPDQLP